MAKTKKTVPEYINYLLAPDTPLDFHVVVGDPATGDTERFGVDKWLLAARSPVMRSMILESPLKHVSEMRIAEIDPDTFKTFLKFVYGLNVVSSLSIEKALKLLNVAEKYEVLDLKDELKSFLRPKVSVKNILIFLEQGFLCDKVPELWATIVGIIQTKTKEVFHHPQFNAASKAVVLCILQQDRMTNVREIDVWRFALAWATNRVVADNRFSTPERLREEMLPLLKHIRLCTLTTEELAKEVIPTKILTYDEVCQICLSVSERKKLVNSDSINDDIIKRITSFNSELKTCSLSIGSELRQWKKGENQDCTTKINIHTKTLFIKLKALIVTAKDSPFSPGLAGDVVGTITMYKIMDLISRISPERSVVTVNIRERVEYGKDLVISLQHQQFCLQPNNLYKVYICFGSTTALYKNSDSGWILNNNDMSIQVSSRYEKGYKEDECYLCTMKALKYEAVAYN